MSFFRNLFSWRSATPKKAEPTPVPAPAPSVPAVAPQPSAARPVAAHAAPEPAPITGDLIPFPLKAITDLFPEELKPAIRKHASEHVEIQIPRTLIEPQLATGAVRLTFAELRTITPEIFFHPEAEGAETKISLPLQMVIARIKPARREGQRQQSLPGNIPAVFGKAGGGPLLNGSVPAAASGAEAWYTPRRPTYEPKPEAPAAAVPAAAAVPQAPAAVAPKPAPAVPEPPKPAPAPAAIAMPTPQPAIAVPQSAVPIPQSAVPVPQPAVPVPQSAVPVPQPAVPIPQPAVAVPQSAVPLPAPDPKPTPTPTPAPSPATDSLSIPVQSVAAALPQEIQDAIAAAGSQTFVIPISEFEPRMRTGRLRFKWSELQAWSVPPASSSANADLDIDLPMAIVVPIFLASRNTSDTRKKFEFDSRIPDVFGKTNAVPSAEPVPVVPAAPVIPPAPVVPPPPAPPVAAAPEPTPDPAPNWESRPLRIESITIPTEPESAAPLPAAVTEQAPEPPAPVIPAEPAIPIATAVPLTGPADAVRKIRELENVTGAFVATTDGLLVAADLAEGNAAILAAFAPTVFSQLSKYTEMAKLGRPEAVELHLGLTTIHVRKAGKLYVGILMPPGHSVPLAALAPISASLQPHSS